MRVTQRKRSNPQTNPQKNQNPHLKIKSFTYPPTFPTNPQKKKTPENDPTNRSRPMPASITQTPSRKHFKKQLIQNKNKNKKRNQIKKKKKKKKGKCNKTFVSLGLLGKLGQVNLGLSLFLGGHGCRERSQSDEREERTNNQKKKHKRGRRKNR